MTEKHPRAPNVRNQLNIAFDKNVRNALDALALEYKIVYKAKPHQLPVPRDAELIRVLLVAELTINYAPEERLACALYCNSVLALSGDFAEVVHKLREDIGEMAGRVTATDKVAPENRSGQRRGLALPTERSSRCRVYLTLDDWLRYHIRDTLPSPVLTDKGRPACAQDVKYVHQLLVNAIENRDEHRLLLRNYSLAITTIRETVRKAVYKERDRLAKLFKQIQQG